MDYLALRSSILSGPNAPACAEHVVTNDSPKDPDYYAKDCAIAALISDGRTRRASRVVNELDIRRLLPVLDASRLIKALRDLESATSLPPGIAGLLTAAGVPESDHWAYLETLQSGYAWLRADGLDVGTERVLEMLQLIGGGLPETSAACTQLAALGLVPDPVTPADVSRALRGPWE